ncbi:MAG TPA: EpsI family protein [Pyrinomonadaceae bacterium]|jgi:exosortase D (VPLPA-CTERM-specific)
MNLFKTNQDRLWKSFLIGILLSFLYGTVLIKLGKDWWIDENYSHGLFVPFIISYIIWLEFCGKRSPSLQTPWPKLGFAIVLFALLMYSVGNLGAELLTQRLSFILLLGGMVVYFWGFRVLQKLTVPFALLLLTIPIPQIILNKIAFPLQIWASRFADWGIRHFDISSVRNGNIIELLPLGSTQVIQLEVVEACSGIRSLMTLITLALLLGYFTRERRQNLTGNWFDFLTDSDFWRIVILMISAIPIALLTNAVRVMTTGIMTYHFGRQAAEGLWHDLMGLSVYVVALILLFTLNLTLKLLIQRYAGAESIAENRSQLDTGVYELKIDQAINRKSSKAGSYYLLAAVLFVGSVFINWFGQIGELRMERRPLREIPAALGAWTQAGKDIRFDAATESVLLASDYIMRDYVSTDKTANLYIGYYESQRAGATYHSPQNCMPGSGWEMRTPQSVEINTPAGKSFTVNRYIVQKGNQRQFLIYWYQGRGRVNSSEYLDKIYMIFDSILKRRSDGAMVRVMVPIEDDESESLRRAIDLSSQVANTLPSFIPD